ncbi:MAG: hypothetical protein ABIY37_05380, partial [Devosia sp.]
MSASLKSLMRDQLATGDTAAPVLAQLFAFLVIGGGAAVAFIVLSAAAVANFATQPAWVVSSLCYAGLILPVYLLHRRYSFRSEAAHSQALPRYIAVQL